jgi:uncharacterized protein (TIGR02391 family)
MGLDDLSDQQLLDLPLDRLGLLVLAYLGATNEWNTHNFANSQRSRGDDAQAALMEAVQWLFNSGLIAKGKPGQSASEAMIITRLGRETLAVGSARLHAQQQLTTSLHVRLERVRTQFLLGEYELAAFAAMREVEIRVRGLARADASLIGVALMQQAFSVDGGPLADPSLERGERLSVMNLFSGAIGTFKNPPSHRQVDYQDPVQASEVVLLADLLLRLLDSTETRMGQSETPASTMC